VRLDGPDVVLDLAGGANAVVSHLARQHDDFLLKLRAARNAARRAALLQWTGDAPIDEYGAFSGDDEVRVVLFPDGITVEGFTGVPAIAPFALVEGIDRDGYTITLRLRSLPPVVFARAAKRTDELLLDVDAAMRAWRARTAEAYAALSPALEGFTASAGWAVGREEAGRWWEGLRDAVAGADRSAELDLLSSLAGDALRLGIATLPGGSHFPFALAPVGGTVAVEGTSSDEARATFVFRTDDVDRLNAVLVLTSFRREALYLPEDRLGRWALAVRTLDVVRWARSALVDRVVHDESWAGKVEAALGRA
jgi:hypothetical protein